MKIKLVLIRIGAACSLLGRGGQDLTGKNPPVLVPGCIQLATPHYWHGPEPACPRGSWVLPLLVLGLAAAFASTPLNFEKGVVHTGPRGLPTKTIAR